MLPSKGLCRLNYALSYEGRSPNILELGLHGLLYWLVLIWHTCWISLRSCCSACVPLGRIGSLVGFGYIVRTNAFRPRSHGDHRGPNRLLGNCSRPHCNFLPNLVTSRGAVLTPTRGRDQGSASRIFGARPGVWNCSRATLTSELF